MCIEEELEAWLLADERALRPVFNDLIAPRQVHRVGRIRTPDSCRNPKVVLTRLFQHMTFRPYVDRTHARLIAERWTDWRRLEASPTFCRFRAKLQA